MKIRTIYKVKVGVKGEKKITPPDQEIEVEDDIGWDLIAQGAATEVNATEGAVSIKAEIQAEVPTEIQKGPEDLEASEDAEDETPVIEQIMGIIPALKPEDFTLAGHPRTEAVSIALGKDVRSDDTKEAWSQYQASQATQATQATLATLAK